MERMKYVILTYKWEWEFFVSKLWRTRLEASINFKKFLQAANSFNVFLSCPDWICFSIMKSENHIWGLLKNFLKKKIFVLFCRKWRRRAWGRANVKFSKVFQETSNVIFWLHDGKTNSIRTTKEDNEAICSL